MPLERMAKSHTHPKLFFCLVLLLLFIFIGAVASPDAEAHYESQAKSFLSSSDSGGDITDALYQIAQILQNNQQHSNLYQRVSVLEASLSLSLEQNKLMEKRIKQLEEKIPAMNDKIEASSNFLAKTEALENSTNDLMGNFEEKLSTLAGEILRLKSIATQSQENADRSNKVTGDIIVEDSREVGERRSDQPHIESFTLQKTKMKSMRETIQGNASSHTKTKIQFGELREMCPSVPSSSFPQNASGCLFTSEGRLVNWTMANRLCQLQGGKLASYSDTESMDMVKGTNIIFWISEASEEKLLEHKEKIVEGNYKYLNDGSNKHISMSNKKFMKGDDGQDITSHNVNILGLDGNLLKNPIENSSRFVDIRNLPHSEETDENIERNVYMANIGADNRDNINNNVASFIADSEGDIKSQHIVKRSLEDTNSLSIPQDAVHFKEFLLLQAAEKDSGHDEPKSEAPELSIPLSDSSSGSADLFSLLKGKSRSIFINKLDRIDDDKIGKKCPLFACTTESTKCLVLMRLCSELNSFWCKKKG